MSIKVRRIDLSPDEWIAGTLGMSIEEEGLYIKICVLIWSTGGRITVEHLKRCTATHGNAVNAILSRLELAGKITRNGSEIGQKRAEKELETARKRIGNARQNGAKGGRPNGLGKATGYSAEKLTINHQLGRKEELSPKALNSDLSSTPAGSPPLPSQGDGGAPLRATTRERLPTSDDLIDPAEKAAALAELHRALGIVSERTAVLNGHAEPAP